MKPGSSKMTHEPLSISVRLRETSRLSVFTWISVPARTVLWLPVILKSLPLRTRAMGGCGARRAAAAARRADERLRRHQRHRIEDSKAEPGRYRRFEIELRLEVRLDCRERFRRPTSPLHTEAFQVGWISQLVVGDDAVVLAVVEHDVGIGDAGHRTVQVVDRQGPVGRATPVVVVEPGYRICGKYTGLALTNFAPLMVLSVADPGAREQQEGERSRLSPGRCPGNSRMSCSPHHRGNHSTRSRGSGNPESGASAGCGHRPFPRASWDCRCSRSRPRTANQPAVT